MTGLSTATIGGLVGGTVTLAGQFIIQYFTHRWQVKRWILDNKKAEYTELLAVLSKSVEQMVQNSSDVGYTHVPQAEKQRRFDEAVMLGRAVIRSRVLIATRMEADGVLERWEMLGAVENTGERSHKWAEIRYALLEGMGKELGLETNIPKPL